MAADPQEEKLMISLKTLIVIAVLLILLPCGVLGQDPVDGHELVVIFSNNIHGELAPCG